MRTIRHPRESDHQRSIEDHGGGRAERQLTDRDIDRLLSMAARDADGSYRVIASKAVAGRPVGPFRYMGTRSDDPNDIVPHEHRRELRAVRVFAAWTNHVDSKAINSLDTLVSENGRTVVRHHLIDFGSTMGSASIKPREYDEGHHHIFDPKPMALGHRAPFVLVSGFLETAAIVSAMRLGAFDVLDKPLDIDTLSAVLRRAVTDQPAGKSIHTQAVDRADAAMRWAQTVLAGSAAARDPRTLRAWAHVAGTSETGLRETCRLINVPARHSRDLMRMLRAVQEASRTGLQPSVFLEVHDHRTLRRLLSRAEIHDERPEVNVYEFLDHQRFIRPSAALDALRDLLREPEGTK